MATIGGGQLIAQVFTLVLLITVTYDDAAALGGAAVYYGLAMAFTPLLDAGASTRLLRDGGLGRLDRTAVRGLVPVKPVVAIVPVLAVVAATRNVALGRALTYPVARGPGVVAQALWQVDGAARRSALLVAGERSRGGALRVARGMLCRGGPRGGTAGRRRRRVSGRRASAARGRARCSGGPAGRGVATPSTVAAHLPRAVVPAGRPS